MAIPKRFTLLFALRTVALSAALAIGGCGRNAATPANGTAELRVLSRAPDARGRYLCRIDSIATAVNGRLQIDCDVGGDTTYSVENDTVTYISRYETAPVADPRMEMLDYWKSFVAPVWERRFRGRPSDIGQEWRSDFVYFQATWDMPDGTREILSISRREPIDAEPSKRVVQRVTLDCRTSGPIGCK